MDVLFNTHRAYTSRGQVIRAVAVSGGARAIFRDFSRGIAGRVEIEPTMDKGLFQARVMAEYDAGRYAMDLDAMDLAEIAPPLDKGDPKCRHDWRIADVTLDRCAKCGREKAVRA